MRYTNTTNTNLQSKLTHETDASNYFLDLLLHRTTQGFEIEFYWKPTSTDTPIHFNSNHLTEHKLAAFRFLLNRVHQLPLTPLHKQKEWNTIVHTAKTNGFPQSILTKLKIWISHKLSLPPTKDTALTTRKNGSLLATIITWYVNLPIPSWILISKFHFVPIIPSKIFYTPGPIIPQAPT
jgi:hypothetical protein